MLKSLFKKQTPAENVKCVKCGKSGATGEDRLCDNCRYMLTIGNILESRK